MRFLILPAAALVLSACTGAQARYPDPIPGSITYHGQPRTKLVNAPVGSIFKHRFNDGSGHEFEETYRIEADRSVLLIGRVAVIDYF